MPEEIRCILVRKDLAKALMPSTSAGKTQIPFDFIYCTMGRGTDYKGLLEIFSPVSELHKDVARESSKNHLQTTNNSLAEPVRYIETTYRFD